MGWSIRGSSVVFALIAACSGPTPDDSTTVGDDTPPLPPPLGAPCVPDDAASTTWDEAAGVFVPVESLVTYTIGDWEGHTVRYFIPEFTPRGVIMPFHGTGGDTSVSLEWDPLFNELIQAGWAVAATESEETAWSFEGGTDNPDTARILRWLDELTETTSLTDDVPLLPIGFSGGGHMVPRFMNGASDGGWIVRGGIAHNSGASGVYGLPFMWVSAENDFDKDGNNMLEARAAHEQHVAEGNPGLLLETPEIPWHPMRMVRHDKYDEVESQEVFDELIAQGIITPDGERIPTIEGHETVLTQFLNQTLLEGPDRVTEQLRVVWGTHRFNGIHAIEECEWVMENYPSE